MRTPWAVSLMLRALAIGVLALPLHACLVVISTTPTALSDANIIFVVVDVDGGLVARATVIVADLDGTWHDRGVTDREGAYRCGVGAGIDAVSVRVDPPVGYAVSRDRPWPMIVDVASSTSQRVELRVVKTPD